MAPPTVVLYLRIPPELRELINKAAGGERGWLARGQAQAWAIEALSKAASSALRPSDAHVEGNPKRHARKLSALNRARAGTAKRSKRKGRK